MKTFITGWAFIFAVTVGDVASAINWAAKSLPAAPPCTTFAKANLVTHYMIPLLDSYDHYICDQLEGTCIYNKNNVPWLHNFGYKDEPLSKARCKNGYGNKQNCLHPCRVLAASMKHHNFGQIIYIKDLVGKKCGNAERDGYEMIHDGYVVVYDTGSPKHFNKKGRFDFFWGRCRDDRGGQCFEGGVQVSAAATNSDYCIAWDPKKPKTNAVLKDTFTQVIKTEATLRRDYSAASEFNLNNL